MEEASAVMQGAQGVLVQNWPTVSSAAGKISHFPLIPTFQTQLLRFVHSTILQELLEGEEIS